MIILGLFAFVAVVRVVSSCYRVLTWVMFIHCLVMLNCVVVGRRLCPLDVAAPSATGA